MKKGKDGIYNRYVKRALDIFLSLAALMLLCWLYALLALLVRIKLGSPVIYKAVRIGKGEKPFVFYKFRSMSNARDASGELLSDAERITPFGAFLRSTSLDELPEAWNILKGDMSFVGPRPLPDIYLPYYTEAERERHSVRGGLTGLAQVNGRNALGWEERFELDVRYARMVSFMLDVKIALQTVKKVVRRADIGLRGVTGPEDLNVLREKNIAEDRK